MREPLLVSSFHITIHSARPNPLFCDQLSMHRLFTQCRRLPADLPDGISTRSSVTNVVDWLKPFGHLDYGPTYTPTPLVPASLLALSTLNNDRDPGLIGGPFVVVESDLGVFTTSVCTPGVQGLKLTTSNPGHPPFTTPATWPSVSCGGKDETYDGGNRTVSAGRALRREFGSESVGRRRLCPWPFWMCSRPQKGTGSM